MPLQDLPHQTAGVQFLVERRRALLADPMGLGKGYTAAAALDLIGASPVLWICPAVTRRGSAREILRRSPDRKVQVVETGSDEITGDVVVVSYELAVAKQIWHQLRRRNWSVIVIDEAQYARNRDAKRTIGIYGRDCDGKNCLIECAERIWLLSGTSALITWASCGHTIEPSSTGRSAITSSYDATRSQSRRPTARK